MPYFSIIIPLYNKEKYIENTLKSVLEQSFTDIEVIVINDGSTDQSVAVVERIKDPRIRLIHQENQGVSVARNKGIELAKASCISFLDADDYWYPQFLETFYQLIQKYPEQAVFSAAFEVETKWGTFLSKYSIASDEQDLVVDFFEASLKECVLWTSCLVIKKEVFDRVGTFDSTIKISQDLDLWIRIGIAYPIVFTHRCLAIYKHDDNSLSKKTNDLRDRLHFEKFEAIEGNHPTLKKYLDLNRYAVAMHCKLNSDHKNYQKLRKDLQLSNLPVRKQILLYCPRPLLLLLLNFQNLLIRLGLRRSVFK